MWSTAVILGKLAERASGCCGSQSAVAGSAEEGCALFAVRISRNVARQRGYQRQKRREFRVCPCFRSRALCRRSCSIL